ncbi:hypothetical protein [Jiangella alkaliphila]|uniref:Uncharacterized protein n=1 Tax=Jiangella alkaliphila TaxID=419479 RepID=A0A1H2HLB5_9ACTN|nr:hypothetical protein [Jiangella alkaliphila]SDU32624.1 hypothetical protein SAMN04488563_1110 [Jiangella alkaliphila]
MRIAVTGHRELDPATTQLVDDAIRERLAQVRADGLAGISCLADGADQVFARAVLDAGGRLVAVVPAAEYRAGLPAEAHAAYDALLAEAAEVRRLEFTKSDPEAHMAASRHLLRHADLLYAVWDGRPARGWGGTADVVREARELGLPVEVIWPDGATR